MALAEWETYARSSRLKSERRRKRLLKKDQDKKLIQLFRELQRLGKEQRDLGYAELIPPIQRGWKRFFVVRADVMLSKDGKFFQELLEKINTTEYSHRKDFKVKKRRRGKKVHVDRIQKLKESEEYYFKKMELTDKEKLYFREEWRLYKYNNRLYKVYVFTEPWRYVLQVKPNMITKVKIIDPLLKRQEDEIDLYLRRNLLYPRIRKLMDGCDRYRWFWGEDARYKNFLKNKPLHEIENELTNKND